MSDQVINIGLSSGGGGGGISTNDGTFATPTRQDTGNTTLALIDSKLGHTEKVVDLNITAPTTQYTLGDAIGDSFTTMFLMGIVTL